MKAVHPAPQLVVLAAGFSARLGRSKALARIRGMTLLRRTLGILSPFSATGRIIVVVPKRAGRYRLECASRGTSFVENPRRATGLSSSVRAGVWRARQFPAVLLLPVDLAALKQVDVARMISRWRGRRRQVIARRVHEHAGSPVILPRWLYPRVADLTGDRGLRDMLRHLPAEAITLISLPSAVADVDTPQDLVRARAFSKR